MDVRHHYAAGEAEEYWFHEGCYILELLNDAAHPALSVARARVPAGCSTRWHRLRQTLEHYVILEGDGTAEIGAAPPFPVNPGDVVVIPPDTRQRIHSGSRELVFLAVCMPRFDPACYQSL